MEATTLNDLKIISEQNTMEVINATYTRIQSKADIHVYRVYANGKNMILKLFDNPHDTREIANYHLLQSLGIQTLPLLGETATAILLPDVTATPNFRLGIDSDMNDPQIATAIATWYKTLHNQGSAYLLHNHPNLYDEADMVTLENINHIAEVTGTTDNPLWQAFTDNIHIIRRRIDALSRTLTYNDFYYTNLVVSIDQQSAFMLDYNLLGKGCAYGDIRNVVSSLSEEAGKAFVNAYGMDDTFAEQAVADAFLAPIITLCYACKHDSFPAWAKPSLEQVKDGHVLTYLYQWLKENEQ